MSPSYQNEKLFIYRALRAIAGGTPLKAEDLLAPPLDWQWILSKCHTQRILPFVAHYCEEHDLLGGFAPDIKRALSLAVLQAEHTLKTKLKSFQIITQILSKENIPVIPLKGTAFAFTIYEKMPFRAMDDIDLLIHESDVTIVHHLLIESGFNVPGHSRCLWRDQILSIPTMPTQLHPLGRFSYYQDKEHNADLHWNPLYAIENNYAVFDLQKIWLRASPKPAIAKNVSFLAPSDLFDLTLAHALEFHSPFLIRYLDLALLMRNHSIHPTKPPLSQQLTIASGARPSFDHFILMIQELFFSEMDPLSFSESTHHILEQTLGERPTTTNTLDTENKHAFSVKFNSVKSLKHKALFLLGYFFPNPHFYTPHRGWQMYKKHWGFLLSRLLGQTK